MLIKLYKSFLLCFLLFCCVLCTVFDPLDTFFKITRLEKCNEADKKFNLHIKFVNFSVTWQNGSKALLRGKLQVVRPLEINFRLSVHGLRCGESQDRTCKHIFSRKFGFICRKLQEPDKIWYPFLTTKFNCPIRVGIYDLGIIEIDINSFSSLPLNNGYWVLKAYGYAGHNVIMCVYSETTIFSTISDNEEESDEVEQDSGDEDHNDNN